VIHSANEALCGSIRSLTSGAPTLVRFLPRSLESTKAPTPPAELTAAVNIDAVEMHSGHILLLLFLRLRSDRVSALLDTFVNLLPSSAYTFFVIFEDQSEAGVVEFNQRSAFFFT
jgi:hypothetical protein